MELKMNEYQLPGKISFNYEELKKELTEKTSMYETLFYTDDQIKEAKTDKANLNKLKKALNDERIRREKEYMKPFNEFKSQINEIIAIIDKPIAAIDKQVKEYEDNQKREKLDKIKALWTQMAVPEGLTMEKVYEERMLNTSFSMKKVETCFELAIGKFNRDMATLAALPEFGFEAQQVYISTFDINKALAEGQRMAQIQRQKAEYEAEQARRKAEEEAKKVAEQVPVGVVTAEEIAQSKQEYIEAASANGVHVPKAPEKQWVAFQALLTMEQAMELKKFFDDRAIEFKAV